VAVAHRQRIDHAVAWLEEEIALPLNNTDLAPVFVLPNGRGLGYGEFRLDDASRRWLMQHLPEVRDALTRASAWLTLWDAMLANRVAPEALFRLAVAAVPLEEDELALQRMLTDVERTFWLFLPDVQRSVEAGRVESTLRVRLEREARVTLKAALASTVRSIATTPATLEWLRAIWSNETQIDGLTLREADYVALAAELAVRSTNADDIVQRQLARTQNDDRRAALAFVAPALSADPARREEFFQSITNVANRRREPWVIDGMRWLHHPIRARESIVFIRPALDLLEDVRRTGDIFLPKRWLDAMFSGHRSPEAAGVVREFLDQRPAEYPLALRRMILASADYLFRAAIVPN
jgi:aminopeptidase N